MKIAIPVEEKSINAGVCVSFERTPYFLIFDTDTNEEKYVENKAASSQGGAGIKAVQTVIDEGTEAVIIPRLGQNAADVFDAGKTALYNRSRTSVYRRTKSLHLRECDSLKYNSSLLTSNKIYYIVTKGNYLK